MSYNKTKYRKYLKQLQEIGLNEGSTSTGTRPTLLANAVKQSYIQQQLQDSNSVFNTFQPASPIMGADEDSSSGGIGSWLLDVISRPLFGVGAGMAANQGAIAGSAGPWAPAPDFGGDSVITKAGKAVEGFGKGITGENKITPGQVVQNNTGLDGVAGFLVGLSADLALDPLNILPVKKGLDLFGMVKRGDLKTAADLKNEATIAAARERKVSEDSDVSDRLEVSTPAVDKLEPAATQVADNALDEALKKAATPSGLTQPGPNAPTGPVVSNVENAARAAAGLPPVGTATGLQLNGMGKAISDNFYQGWLDTLSGRSRAMEIEPLYKELKSKFDLGYIKDVDDVKAALNVGRKTPFVPPIAKPLVDAGLAEKVAPHLDDSKYVVKDAGDGFRTIGQAYRFQDVVRDVAKAVPPAAVGDDVARTAAVKTETMSRLKTLEEASENAGNLHYVDSDLNGRYALKQSDVIEVLSDGIQAKYVWSAPGTTKAKPAALAAGAAKAMDVAGTSMRVGQRVESVAHAIWTASKAKTARGAGTQITPKIAREIAREFIAQAPELTKRATLNATRGRIKIERDVARLREVKEAELKRVASDPTMASSEAAKAVLDTPKQLDDLAKNLGATPASAIIAGAELAAETAKVADRGTVALMESAERVGALKAADNVDEEAIKAVRSKAAKENTDAAEAELKAQNPHATDDEIMDMGMAVGNERQVGWRDRHSPTTKAIVELNRAVGTHTAISRAIFNFRKLLTGFDKIPMESQIQAFSAIRQGREVGPQFAKLKEAYNTVFDSADSTMSALIRNGATWDQINAALEAMWKYGNKTNKKVPQFKEIKGPGGWQKTADQMKEFVVEDPADFLERSYGALRQLAAHQTVAMSFENKFASKVAKPGYVKIGAAADSLVGQHLQKGLYYPRDAITALNYVEHVTGKARGFGDSTKAFGKFVDSIYDPVLGVWKAYNTIMRPGHHVRNGIGDAFLSQMRGMKNFGKYYTEATKLMLGKTANYSKTVTFADGKSITLSGDEVLRHFEEMGLRPDYASSEDLLVSANEVKRGKIYHGLMENPVAKFMGRVSENTGAEGRLAQFIFELGHGENLRGVKDIDQLVAVAARNTRKWHPDSSGILGKEAQIMRRIVPFYSWVRQAIPLVVETSLYHPGRVLALPKASYELAIANGAEPESLSNQFDQNELYPSFIMNNILGPYDQEGNAFTVGSPVESLYGDFLNDYASNPQSLLGEVSPLIKGIPELIAEQNFSTGRRIVDKSEYFDSANPILAKDLSAISGYSVSGTIDNILSGAPEPDPQRIVLRGEKEHWLNDNLINWFTGAGLQNYQKPSYTRIAQTEARSTG